MPAGRPTDYDPAYCETVVELGKEGKSFTQIAVALDTSKASLHRWMEAHEEFRTAVTRAKECEQAWWEDAAMTGKAGDMIHPTVWAKSVAARFRDDYTERKEIDAKQTIVIDSDADKL